MSPVLSALTARAAAGPTAMPDGVWRADSLAAGRVPVVSSGHAALDAGLPGGGWPVGALCEVLQPAGARAEWQLLLPALAQQPSGAVVLVGAPGGHVPCAPALQARGLVAQRLLWVRADDVTARLWSAEQALRCADVAAVLVWLPRTTAAGLRRLHAAAQGSRALLFALRPLADAQQASPAWVRVRLDPADEQVAVHLLKRRGPPLDHPVLLPGLPARLVATLMAHEDGACQVMARFPLSRATGRRHVRLLDRAVCP